MKKKSDVNKMVCILEFIVALMSGLFATLACRLIMWVFKTWNHLEMQELVYHLKAPVQGTNAEMVKEAVLYCVPAVLGVGILIIWIFYYFRRKKGFHVYSITIIFISLFVFGGACTYAWQRLDIRNYLENKTDSSSFIDDNYINPQKVEITFPKEKRNLIYIYLESMETTYSDIKSGGGFETNYIPRLTQLAQDYEDFSGNTEELNGGHVMPGTSWTVAAMLAHSSGLPLNIPIDGNAMDTQDHFFPQIIAIGDILEEEGYAQTVLFGSQAVFGGKLNLYKEHGNYKIRDYDYALNNGMIPEGYMVWWGYEDAKLFEFAKQELAEMAENETPFNLTMLTADTHFEDGYVCQFCGKIYGDDQYANVMACSDKQVLEFIEWVQQQDFYENTTIVLAGDHLTMDRDFCQNVDKDYERKVYTAYLNSAVESVQNDFRREYTTFDYLPTTLAALGVKIEGERLGLGTNLFSEEPTLIEKYGKDVMTAEVQKKSQLMDNLTADIFMPEDISSASVTVDSYNQETGALVMSVHDFENLNEEIKHIAISVCLRDENNVIWVPTEKQEDGSYRGGITLDWTKEEMLDSVVTAYVRTVENNRYELGSIDWSNSAVLDEIR